MLIMTPNTLYPSYVTFDYHSSYAPHTMTVPTTRWSPGGTYGSFLAHDASNVDAETMCDDFIDAAKKFFRATVIFDGFTIWNIVNPGDSPHPMVSKSVTEPGSSVLANAYNVATQATWTFYTAIFGIAKIVMLDVETAGFAKILSGTASVDQTAFIALMEDDANAWAGRDGSRPNQFKQIAFTLNEKLRRSYNLN